MAVHLSSLWDAISGRAERRLRGELAALRLRLDRLASVEPPLGDLHAEITRLRRDLDGVRRQDDSLELRLSVRLVALEMAVAAGAGESRDQERRIEDVSGRCGGLWNELPKFVQPVVEARSEAVMLGNRFNVIAEDFVALRARIEELVATRIRQTDLEERIAPVVRMIEALAAESRTTQQSFDERDAVRAAALDQAKASLEALEERWLVASGSGETDGRTGDGTVPGSEEDALAHAQDKRGPGINHQAVAELLSTVAGLSDELAALRHDKAGFAAELQHVREQVAKAEADLAAFHQRREGLEASIGDTRVLIGADDPSRLFVAAVNDGVMLLKRGDLVSESAARTGGWDAHILDVMSAVAAVRGGTAVDVGTHFGTMMLSMARRFEKVACFEPNDFSFRMAKANIALNGLTNVELHNFPLFSRTVEMSLGEEEKQEIGLPQREGGGFDPLATPNIGGYMFTPGGTSDYPHMAKRLDDLSLDDVSFIKIDVQGADGEVIMGAKGIIARCRPVIVFEWEEHLSIVFSVSLEAIREFLNQQGYVVQVLRRHNEKQADYVAYPAVNPVDWRK